MPDTESTETERYPGESDEAHPELFDLNARPPPAAPKPGQLTEEQVKQYFELVCFNHSVITLLDIVR